MKTLGGQVVEIKTCLLTTNGGQLWELVYTGISANYECCCFVNQYTGWVAGSNGIILKTTNGGLNWSQQLSGTTQNLAEMCFVNTTTGFAVRSYGIIIKTTNQGTTWVTKPSGTMQSFFSVNFVNNNTGWCVGGNIPNTSLIMQTTNSGEIGSHNILQQTFYTMFSLLII